MANQRASTFTLTIALILSVGSMPLTGLADEQVFSGPQVGEKLPELAVEILSGNQSEDNESSSTQQESFAPIADAGDGPVLLIFVQELTRPGFGLARAVATFAAKRNSSGIKSTVVFLTEDPTKTRKWASNVRQHFAQGVNYAVSLDGPEGPGAYGLNRNVKVTILVGEQGKVTSNFALVQPQLQADGPAILKAIAAVTGGGEIPDMADLEPAYRGRNRMQKTDDATESARDRQDGKLRSLLRGVINKSAKPEDVREAASKVEAYLSENEPAQKELARILHTIIGSGKLTNYGTKTAQEILQGWHESYPHEPQPDAKE